jgi:magnesium chelatase family protein
MPSIVLSATVRGVEAVPVAVEVDLAGGTCSFVTVGLAEAAVRESRVRVQAAIENSDLVFPLGRITVNLAPAHLKKDGTGFDLPMALAILDAHGAFKRSPLGDVLALGELSLSGEVRPVRGALAAAEAALRAGRKRVLVAPENGAEAALVHGVEVRVVRTLADAVAYLAYDEPDRAPLANEMPAKYRALPLDLDDVKGQESARTALELAAAGGHNILFVGGPGTGKSMLARRLPGILPPMSRAEALEVTRVHSVAGLNIGGGLVAERPFRAPHHSTTPAGLVGGGSALPRPGEVTLAHEGVLFLDELPEFARSTLEVLREPLETAEVSLSRASGTVVYPAKALLVASMNPCPCGRKDSGSRVPCRCQAIDVQRYQSRVSGPLLDRIDLRVPMAPVGVAALEDEKPGESSASVAARVILARRRQAERFGAGITNATASTSQMREHVRPDAPSKKALAYEIEQGNLSARGYDRCLRVARTVADLKGSDRVDVEHVAFAIFCRHKLFEGAHMAPAPAAGLDSRPG